MFVTILLSLILILVDSAPLTNKSQLSENKETEEEAFEEFFENLSPEVFEEAKNDLTKVIEVEKDFDAPPDSKNGDIKNSAPRSRRSANHDTMMALKTRGHSGYYQQVLKRKKRSICMRRCYWKRMFYLCKYGRHISGTCYC